LAVAALADPCCTNPTAAIINASGETLSKF
jgi:hypothetical protein